MRQVVLDTETTGLNPKEGHRIIEIGCVELIDRCRSGRRFHRYLNAEREIDEGAFNVHGIDEEQLRDMPRFAEIYREWLDFIRDAELIIHNAPFDVEFLDHELSLLNGAPGPGRITDYCTVVDSLERARELHPGRPNSLDALCKRYGIDTQQRQRHGALLDAELLTSVYLAMTAGGQAAMQLANRLPAFASKNRGDSDDASAPRPLVIAANAAEREAHNAMLDAIESQSGYSLWRKLGY